METKKLISTIGTLVIVGAVSTAGAALWTNVLDDKLKLVKAKKTHSESDKVTMLHVESGYAGQESKGILCIIPPRKQFAAKELIYAVDQEAFLTITQVWEVQGRGFSFDRRTDKGE